MFGGLFKGRKVTKAKKVSYEESKEYAVSDSHAERKALAKRTDVKPELLYYLAEDKSPTVRRKVATNPSTVRRHINWNHWQPDLREDLAHLV